MLSISFLYTLFKVGVIFNSLQTFMRKNHGDSFRSKGGYLPPLYICVNPNCWIIRSLLRLWSNIAKGEIMPFFLDFPYDLKVELRINSLRWLEGEGSSYLLELGSLSLELNKSQAPTSNSSLIVSDHLVEEDCGSLKTLMLSIKPWWTNG